MTNLHYPYSAKLPMMSRKGVGEHPKQCINSLILAVKQRAMHSVVGVDSFINVIDFRIQLRETFVYFNITA